MKVAVLPLKCSYFEMYTRDNYTPVKGKGHSTFFFFFFPGEEKMETSKSSLVYMLSANISAGMETGRRQVWGKIKP